MPGFFIERAPIAGRGISRSSASKFLTVCFKELDLTQSQASGQSHSPIENRGAE
ncbi:hypothetical protein RGR602_CH02147 [Rhizobium gallicum bv. gallicum R602sp]|uniref:Uncharacterized protein n=1 Tax=Rhizobium gallicum bv. gallicum R602sp TaxID=1041138 RepID=A0A0B4X460_9HYPH|nr:hypothetical protein RGR602_CH02147 [Rhizobium gallicum bv. gallicum R602sp]